MTGPLLGLIIAATGIAIGVLIGAVLWRKPTRPTTPPPPRPVEPQTVTGDIGAAGTQPPPELAPERFDATARIEIDDTIAIDNRYVLGPDIDLDEEVVLDRKGERITEDRAEQIADATLALPDLNNETIAIGGPTLALEATNQPAGTIIPANPEREGGEDYWQRSTAVAAWRPPDPIVVLTVAWKRPDAPLIAGRYDITEDMPDEVIYLYHAMQHQQEHFGGDITVAVKIDGHARDDWEWTANQEWPRQSIDAIRQAREQLKVPADAG